jgi:NAD(P)-dependent dehydrogenase (short-subunit alcohol dehydrogenase family)
MFLPMMCVMCTHSSVVSLVVIDAIPGFETLDGCVHALMIQRSTVPRWPVAKALTAERCRVVLADRNVEKMEEVAKTLSFHGVSDRHRSPTSSPSPSLPYRLVECDVTDPSQVQDLIRQADQFATDAGEEGGNCSSGVDQAAAAATATAATLLVNCAGITRDQWISRMDLKDWDDVIDVNLRATFLTCRHFLDQKRMDQLLVGSHYELGNVSGTNGGTGDNAGGSASAAAAASIVNIGSIVSELGNLGQANYAASKGGVLGLTRALAKEVANRNVRVNAVLPGFIDTPMARAVPDHVRERIVKGIPLGRFGRPDEVADLVTFLLSPRSAYITGESVAISGMISL